MFALLAHPLNALANFTKAHKYSLGCGVSSVTVVALGALQLYRVGLHLQTDQLDKRRKAYLLRSVFQTNDPNSIRDHVTLEQWEELVIEFPPLASETDLLLQTTLPSLALTTDSMGPSNHKTGSTSIFRHAINQLDLLKHSREKDRWDSALSSLHKLPQLLDSARHTIRSTKSRYLSSISDRLHECLQGHTLDSSVKAPTAALAVADLAAVMDKIEDVSKGDDTAASVDDSLSSDFTQDVRQTLERASSLLDRIPNEPTEHAEQWQLVVDSLTLVKNNLVCCIGQITNIPAIDLIDELSPSKQPVQKLRELADNGGSYGNTWSYYSATLEHIRAINAAMVHLLVGTNHETPPLGTTTFFFGMVAQSLVTLPPSMPQTRLQLSRTAKDLLTTQLRENRLPDDEPSLRWDLLVTSLIILAAIGGIACLGLEAYRRDS